MVNECEGQSTQGELTVSIVYVLFLCFFCNFELSGT